jgi:hypothetical protein
VTCSSDSYLYVNLIASKVRRRLKGQGFDVRQIESAVNENLRPTEFWRIQLPWVALRSTARLIAATPFGVETLKCAQ